ncbi:hypothetical protein ACFVYA_34590 [Amycolatopsis sp. NPDC058278]|uniref:hypothetical protein n=1 Tax=Amycolatopsis sp. NPDC058278 TaxID=3346417 RepID=UPI0036DAE307
MSSERRGGLLLSTEAADRHPARIAVDGLGWDGVVVPDITLFGRQVSVLALVDGEAHALRLRQGIAPVTDRTTVALWEWPELSAPPSAARLSAVIATGPRWQTGMTAVSGFAGFASTMLLLEQNDAVPRACLTAAERYGVWVLRSGRSGVVVDHRGRMGPVVSSRPTTVTRWTEELVYARILEDGLIAPAPAG